MRKCGKTAAHSSSLSVSKVLAWADAGTEIKNAPVGVTSHGPTEVSKLIDRSRYSSPSEKKKTSCCSSQKAAEAVREKHDVDACCRYQVRCLVKQSAFNIQS